jgi:hypothetical protein
MAMEKRSFPKKMILSGKVYIFAIQGMVFPERFIAVLLA